MANRYWVGGTDTWDSTAGTKWAATSGGAGGQTVPGVSDTVYFDAASGNNVVTLGTGYNPSILTMNMNGFTGTLAFGSQNISLVGNNTIIFIGSTSCTITGTPVINCTYSGATGTRSFQPQAVSEANAISFNITAGTDTVGLASNHAVKNFDFSGFSGTLANGSRTIYGNLTISSGMTCTAGASATTFAATSGTQQITTNGKTLDFPILFNGVGGTFQLQDDMTVGSTRTVTLTNGALNLTGNSGNWTLSTGLFNSSNSNTRSIAFGTGNITVTGNAATVWTTATATGLSVTGTPVVNLTYSGSTGTRNVSMGVIDETNAISVNITAGSDTVSLNTASGSYKNIDYTGFSGTGNFGNSIFIWGNLTISSGMTVGSGTSIPQFKATSETKTITTML